MRTILSLLIFALMCLSAEGQIPETLQQKLEAMASDSALEEALVGICVRTADGKTIVDISREFLNSNGAHEACQHRACAECSGRGLCL